MQMHLDFTVPSREALEEQPLSCGFGMASDITPDEARRSPSDHEAGELIALVNRRP